MGNGKKKTGKVNGVKTNRDRVAAEKRFYQEQCRQLTIVNQMVSSKFNQCLAAYNNGNKIIVALRVMAEGLTDHVCSDCPLGFEQGKDDCENNLESDSPCIVHSLIKESEEKSNPPEEAKEGAEAVNGDGDTIAPVDGVEAVRLESGGSGVKLAAVPDPGVESESDPVPIPEDSESE
jgi:hypothetical protein